MEKTNEMSPGDFSGSENKETLRRSVSLSDETADTLTHAEGSEIEKNEKSRRSISSPQEKTHALVHTATAEPDNEPSLKATTTREDGTEYPTGPKLTLIVLALCLSVFLVALGMYCSSFSSIS